MEIGLDFDGVIALSHPLKSAVALERFGVYIPVESFRRGHVVQNGLLTEDQYREVGQEAMGGKYPIPPVVGAIIYIQHLIQHKHHLRVITSRTEGMLEVARGLLEEYKLPLPLTGIGYGLPKIEGCRGLSVYVDDDLEKLTPLIGVVPHLLFFSWPWNMHEQEPAGIMRVSGWRDIYDYIWNEVR